MCGSCAAAPPLVIERRMTRAGDVADDRIGGRWHLPRARATPRIVRRVQIPRGATRWTIGIGPRAPSGSSSSRRSSRVASAARRQRPPAQRSRCPAEATATPTSAGVTTRCPRAARLTPADAGRPRAADGPRGERDALAGHVRSARARRSAPSTSTDRLRVLGVPAARAARRTVRGGEQLGRAVVCHPHDGRLRCWGMPETCVRRQGASRSSTWEGYGVRASAPTDGSRCWAGGDGDGGTQRGRRSRGGAAIRTRRRRASSSTSRSADGTSCALRADGTSPAGGRTRLQRHAGRRDSRRSAAAAASPSAGELRVLRLGRVGRARVNPRAPAGPVRRDERRARAAAAPSVASGTLACWGEEGYRRRHGRRAARCAPRPARGRASPSASDMRCAIRPDGRAVCWGSSDESLRPAPGATVEAPAFVLTDLDPGAVARVPARGPDRRLRRRVHDRRAVGSRRGRQRHRAARGSAGSTTRQRRPGRSRATRGERYCFARPCPRRRRASSPTGAGPKPAARRWRSTIARCGGPAPGCRSPAIATSRAPRSARPSAARRSCSPGRTSSRS